MGTLHMMCASDLEIKDKVKKAISVSDQIIFEINLSDPQEITKMTELTLQGSKISEVLTAEEFEKLDAALAPKLGFSIKALDQIGLQGLYSFMITKSLPCQEIKSLEMELIQLALSNQLPITSFEKVQEQFDVFSKSYSTQDYLEQLHNFDRYSEDFLKAIDAYKNEDIEKSVALIAQEKYMNSQATKYMVEDRNINWVKQLETILPKTNSFIAVGAAHLVGPSGLIYQLQQQGYIITPIY